MVGGTGRPAGVPPAAPVAALTVFLLTGIPASGKSTVGGLLARRFERALHVDGDVFRDMVVAGRVDMTPDPLAEAVRQLHLRYRQAAATADLAAAEGFTVVLQDNYLGPQLADVVEMVRTRPLHVVVLVPRPEVVAAREAARGKTAYGAWTVEQMHEGFRATTPRIGLWLDTSDQTPDETVDEILARTVSG